MRNIIINHLVPRHHFDITATTGVVNEIIGKIMELAENHMVNLPEEVQLYTRIDVAEIADALKKVASWQAIVVDKIGLPTKLKPKIYEQVDYNSVGFMTDYYGVKINAIIDAADSLRQNPMEAFHGSY
jgi:F420-0:gamma-glutamyl ligase-like protein